ncbi:MAG: hypothetical protein H7Y03_05745, partial [Chitinophagaceae bacterium]|nr:hypothetical protein [Chitinophagaceae bacterium]
DTNFFFVPFYKIRDLPFLALYNAKGELLQTYAGTTDIQKVADGFQKKSKKKR